MAYIVHITPTDAADTDALAQLMHDSIHALCGGAYTPEQMQAWSPAPRRGDAAKQRFSGQTAFIAQDEFGPAAFMTLTPEGYLDFAYAHPRAEGKGAARWVYDALEEYAREAGLTELTSDISIIARPFMERRGWTIVRAQQPVLNGVALDNIHMRKILTT